MTRKPRKLEQVVEAAIAEFQENGFTAANMDRISERAHVSKRTLYNYFDSKEVLFQEIVIRASVETVTAVMQQASSGEMGSEPELVAEVIWNAATDGTATLRYTAGDDAAEYMANRKALDDETFMNGMKTQMGL